jgi:hypothetical protein
MKKDGRTGMCGYMGEARNVCTVLVGESEGRRTLKFYSVTK